MKILSYKDTFSYHRKHNVLVESMRAVKAYDKKIKLINTQIRKARKEKNKIIDTINFLEYTYYINNFK